MEDITATFTIKNETEKLTEFCSKNMTETREKIVLTKSKIERLDKRLDTFDNDLNNATKSTNVSTI